MPRFDTEWTTATRLVLSLTVIVALVALSVGIKDYLRPKNAKPVASASTPTIVLSDAKTVRQKTTSPKTTRARMSGTGANAPETEQATADTTDKRLVSSVFPRTGTKRVRAIDNAPNTVTAQPAQDSAEAAMDRAAMDRNNRVRKQFDAITACVPLPNGTKPGDADADYYQNWAREYSCVF